MGDPAVMARDRSPRAPGAPGSCQRSAFAVSSRSRAHAEGPLTADADRARYTRGDVAGRRPTGARPRARATSGSTRVLDFVAFAARPMPLLTLLDEAPAPHRRHLRGRRLLALPARGRQERARDARQRRLLRTRPSARCACASARASPGEAVEYMRPISTSAAEQHGAYKHFAELGEERFPVFLAVPIRGQGGAARRARRAAAASRRSRTRDIELLAALGGLIAAGIRTRGARRRGARERGRGAPAAGRAR